MTKISEALDQYTGICKEAMMTSSAKLSKSFEKDIIEVLLLYSGAVDNAIYYSLLESCELAGVPPLRWLTHTLKNFHDDTTEEQLQALLPHNYKKSRE